MSLNLDTSVLFDMVSQIVNAYWPVVALTAGVGLAFGILAFVAREFKKAV